MLCMLCMLCGVHVVLQRLLLSDDSSSELFGLAAGQRTKTNMKMKNEHENTRRNKHIVQRINMVRFSKLCKSDQFTFFSFVFSVLLLFVIDDSLNVDLTN